jgi:hypothetical protein
MKRKSVQHLIMQETANLLVQDAQQLHLNIEHERSNTKRAEGALRVHASR